MRELIYDALTSDTTLVSLGLVPEAVLSGDVDTPMERPFLNLRWGPNTPGLADVTQRDVVIWFHDEPGDYARIDQLMRRVKTIFAGLVANEHTYGYLILAEWRGDSEDLTDAGHGTITRTATYSLTGTGQ